MKIRITELKEDVNKLRLQANPEDLDLQNQEADFNSPIVCDLTCSKSQNKFFCQGELSTKVNFECARCLVVFSYDLKTRFDFILDVKDNQVELSAEGEDFETKVAYGDDLDIGHLVREALLLALPLKPLCSLDCKGLCPVCGTDLNTSSCDCHDKRSDPRWEKLKDFFKK
jgi:uncharacterized protein